MPGASQGSAYPGHRPTHLTGVSPKHSLNSGNAGSLWACRGRRNPPKNVCQPRPRIEFSDADKVRERVEADAARLRLRGARRHALAAVLKLLCGWSRIADDRVGLPQVVDLIVAAGGRRYDLKTVGRALAGLVEAELIVYRPAQGRGKRSFIAIHDRFVGDIEVLDRDDSGSVIVDYSGLSEAESVTFSEPLPYKDQKNYPPTPRTETPLAGSRPVGVEVSSQDLRTVLRGLPEPLARLPRHLRWMLGAEIRKCLERGWLPHQILGVLKADMPADVQRPWRLALWRLRHNVIGSGPRLKPLQQAWDARELATQRATHEAENARWFADVEAVTTPVLRAQVLKADEVHCKRRTTPDPVCALANAGRRAARLFPDMPLGAALQRWSTEILATTVDPEPEVREGVSRPTTLQEDMLMNLAISGGCTCVMCGSDRGMSREELPLKSSVCDRCWPHVAAELAADDHDIEFEEAIAV